MEQRSFALENLQRKEGYIADSAYEGLHEKVTVKRPGHTVEVFRFLDRAGRAEAAESKYLAKDEASDDSFWMRGVWWDVQVQILFLLVDSGVQPAIHNGDREVHKINACRELGAFPL